MSQSIESRGWRFGWCLLLSAAVTSGAGCGSGSGDVTGKVTFQNKPLTFGSVMIVGSDGLTKYGEIKDDGSYSVQGVRSGTARAAVNSPDPLAPLFSRDGDSKGSGRSPEESRRLEGVKKRWFPIPEYYGDPAKSNLSFDVRSGANTQNIELK